MTKHFKYTAAEIIAEATRLPVPARHSMTLDGVVEVVDEDWPELGGFKFQVVNAETASGLLITDPAGRTQGIALSRGTTLTTAVALFREHKSSREFMEELPLYLLRAGHPDVDPADVATAIVSCVNKLRDTSAEQGQKDHCTFKDAFTIEGVTPEVTAAARDMLRGVIKDVERVSQWNHDGQQHWEIVKFDPDAVATWVRVPVDMTPVNRGDN